VAFDDLLVLAHFCRLAGECANPLQSVRAQASPFRVSPTSVALLLQGFAMPALVKSDSDSEELCIRQKVGTWEIVSGNRIPQIWLRLELYSSPEVQTS
jgi:hypothetical protein